MSIIKEYKKIVSYPLNEDCFQQINTSSWVYLMYNRYSNLYKIGITNSLKNRWKAISLNSGGGLKLVQAIEMEAEYDESALDAERAIHKIFKNKRVCGEWFALSIYDLARLLQLMYFLEGCDFWDRQSIWLKDYKKDWDVDF
jgi:predicted GIY-YIG superfamily endonuclease